MGSDLKHSVISSLRSAWQTLNDFARAHTSNTQLQAELAIVANQIQQEEQKQLETEEGEGEFGPTCQSATSKQAQVTPPPLIMHVSDVKH